MSSCALKKIDCIEGMSMQDSRATDSCLCCFCGCVYSIIVLVDNKEGQIFSLAVLKISLFQLYLF